MIELSKQDDLAHLAAVEASAGQKFKEFYKDDPANRVHRIELGSHTLGHSILLEAYQNETLWVTKKQDKPIGFLAATELDGLLHIQELSVMFEHQGKGIGKELLEVSIEGARDMGYPGISLTTDRTIPWNEPFYKKYNFIEAAVEKCGPRLTEILLKEKSRYDTPADRIAMILKF